MTKEQEAMKYIEKRIKVCNENADICDDNNFDEEATYLREESYMLETVLSMLKEKDRQIDLIAEQLAGLTIWNNKKEEPLILGDKEEVKNYYKNLN